MKVLKLTDRVKIKIGDVTFKVAPLSYENKLEMAGCFKMDGGTQVQDIGRQMILALKYGVKEVEGITYADGTEYSLVFNDDGSLSDLSLSELLTGDQASDLLSTVFAVSNLNKDPQLEGVEVEMPGSVISKKKSSSKKASSRTSGKK